MPGDVYDGLPGQQQTVLRAELFALSTFLRLLSAAGTRTRVDIASDRKCVVTGCNGGNLPNTCRNGDLWSETLGILTRGGAVGHAVVRKVKAHATTMGLDARAISELDYFGIYLADYFARKGAQAVEVPLSEAARIAEIDARAWKVQRRIIATHMLAIGHDENRDGTVEEARETHATQRDRADKRITRPPLWKVTRDSQHSLYQLGRSWRCATCMQGVSVKKLRKLAAAPCEAAVAIQQSAWHSDTGGVAMKRRFLEAFNEQPQRGIDSEEHAEIEDMNPTGTPADEKAGGDACSFPLTNGQDLTNGEVSSPVVISADVNYEPRAQQPTDAEVLGEGGEVGPGLVQTDEPKLWAQILGFDEAEETVGPAPMPSSPRTINPSLEENDDAFESSTVDVVDERTSVAGRLAITIGATQLHNSHLLSHRQGVVFRWRCGCYATAAPRRLGSERSYGADRAGKAVLSRFRRGLTLRAGMEWPLIEGVAAPCGLVSFARPSCADPRSLGPFRTAFFGGSTLSPVLGRTGTQF